MCVASLYITVFMCIYACAYMCINVCFYVCAFMCAYIECVCMCVLVCIYIFSYIYTHTNACIYMYVYNIKVFFTPVCSCWHFSFAFFGNDFFQQCDICFSLAVIYIIFLLSTLLNPPSFTKQCVFKINL